MKLVMNKTQLIDPNIIEQLLNLPAEDLCDLTKALGNVFLFSSSLLMLPEKQFEIAFYLINYGYKILESLGYKIDAIVSNPIIDRNYSYRTGDNNL